MNHLSEDKLYHLAELVTQERPFTQEDVSDMQHIGQCDDCYGMLRCMMALMETLDNVDVVALTSQLQPTDSVFGNKSVAVLQLVISGVLSSLEQLDAQMSIWTFDAPLVLAGTRSTQEKAPNVQKLEDVDNSETFVAYDPTARVLVIQLDHAQSNVPAAFLVGADGNKREITFEQREHLLWAEICGLEDGAYKIIFE